MKRRWTSDRKSEQDRGKRRALCRYFQTDSERWLKGRCHFWNKKCAFQHATGSLHPLCRNGGTGESIAIAQNPLSVDRRPAGEGDGGEETRMPLGRRLRSKVNWIFYGIANMTSFDLDVKVSDWIGRATRSKRIAPNVPVFASLPGKKAVTSRHENEKVNKNKFQIEYHPE